MIYFSKNSLLCSKIFYQITNNGHFLHFMAHPSNFLVLMSQDNQTLKVAI